METESKITQDKGTVQAKANPDQQASGNAEFDDNRSHSVAQRKLRAGMASNPLDESTVQLRSAMESKSQNANKPIQRKANRTGLPDRLKSGIENLSGFSMNDVKVHYNSNKPTQLQAHAYAQGTDIHLAPGQEKHLPHEAWHVVQQKQGRVKPTRQLKSKVAINDDAGLEKEADVMGAKALGQTAAVHQLKEAKVEGDTAQLQKISPGAKVGLEIETTLPVRKIKPQGATELTKAMIDHVFDPSVREQGENGKSKSDQNLGNLELKAKERIYQGNGWRAEADHMAKIERLYEKGILWTRAGVEIVTEPISTLAEARATMMDIQTWVNNTLALARGRGAPFEYDNNFYVVEMPGPAQSSLLDRNNGVWGNFQVNFGAFLQDVPDLFVNNADDIISRYYREPQKMIIDFLADQGLWAEIWQNCADLVRIGELKAGDEPFLRSIMFQNMYEALAHHTMTTKAGGQRNDSEKNYFSIMRKTSMFIQIALSDMPSKTNFMNPKLAQKFAAICKQVFDSKLNDNATKELLWGKEDAGKGTYDGGFKSIGGDEATIYADRQEVNDPANLKLDKENENDPDRHAGVFEVRGLQGKLIPQQDWLAVWLHYLDDSNPNPHKKETKITNFQGRANPNFANRGNFLMNNLGANRAAPPRFLNPPQNVPAAQPNNPAPANVPAVQVPVNNAPANVPAVQVPVNNAAANVPAAQPQIPVPANGNRTVQIPPPVNVNGIPHRRRPVITGGGQVHAGRRFIMDASRDEDDRRRPAL